jgi:hypothetical protein
METLLQDLHYSLRRLIQSPQFTLTAGLSLALGLAALRASRVEPMTALRCE